MHVYAHTCTKGLARKAYAGSGVLFFEEFEIEFLSERSIGNFDFVAPDREAKSTVARN